MKKIVCLFVCLFAGSANAALIGVTGYNNTLHNAETVAASLGGGSSATTLVNSVTFNSWSTSELLSAYDMLVIGWLTDSSYDLDWSTVLLPYLQGGGAISWEDPNNRSELYAGSGLSAGFSGSVSSYSGVFGANTWTNPHFGFEISGAWECIASNPLSSCAVARNSFGAGRIVVSEPDEFYHDNNAENDAYLLSQTEWLLDGGAASVPEPTSIALLGLGLAVIGFSRRKVKA